MSGASMVDRLPRKRKSRTIAMPSRIPRRIPIRRSRAAGRRGSADPVEQAPVGPEGRLRRLDERVLVPRPHRLLDQPARLIGVSVVGHLMDAEVLAARSAVDPVELLEPLALDPRDLGLPALNRVHAGELLEVVGGGGPAADALGGLVSRLRADLAAGRLDEVVPEPDMGLLLGSVRGDLLAVLLRSGLRGLAAEAGQRLGCVAVLTGVASQLL